MTENVDNLVLEFLRGLRGEMAYLREDMREVKSRLTSLEMSMAGVRRDITQVFGDTAETHLRHDRLAERLERVEGRLDLRDDGIVPARHRPDRRGRGSSHAPGSRGQARLWHRFEDVIVWRWSTCAGDGQAGHLTARPSNCVC